MNYSKRIQRTFLGAAVTIGALVVPTPVTAAVALPASSCVVTVTGTDANGNFELGPMHCYSSYAQVLRSNGVVAPDSATPATTSPQTLQEAGIIATHYDGSNFTGASVSVQGTDCNGGGLQVPTTWNDRISSTANGCGTIVHYENTQYGGASFATTGAGGNITGYMDNKTSSIKYFA